MMTLDQRARRAAEAVHEAARTYQPATTMTDVARRRIRSRALGTAVAGLAVFAALIAGTWLTVPDQRNDVAEPSVPPVTTGAPTEPTAPPTIPEITTPPPTTAAPVLPEGEPAPEPGDTDPGGEILVAPPVTTAPPSTEAPVTTTAAPEPTDTKPPATVDAVDTTPPRIAITSPEDGAVLDERKVRFKGKTEPGATVTVGRYEAKVGDDGSWSLVLVLTEGRNRILFRAFDAAGNEGNARITVYYEPPPPVTEPPPPDVDFTANATYGSCSEDPPYDVYYGNAEPGTKVQILSEYGSGHTYADAEGHWELKVFFHTAPANKTFLVTAKDAYGNTKKFEFTSYLVK